MNVRTLSEINKRVYIMRYGRIRLNNHEHIKFKVGEILTKF